mgnify:FL=1
MQTIDANKMESVALNAALRAAGTREIRIGHCVGQRYIGTGLSDCFLEIDGTPGNALGAYLNGGVIRVRGNVQEATGDTMNGGEIVVDGSAGDATGYAMRGGKIFVRGDVGYRCGIHIKAYRENRPAIVIGGRAGSFLGEYQAGGVIIVLGLHTDGRPIVGNFCGTGMHGGEIFLRGSELPARLPAQVRAEEIGTLPDEAEALVREWCSLFERDPAPLLRTHYIRLTPDSGNPYRQLYVGN